MTHCDANLERKILLLRMAMRLYDAHAKAHNRLLDAPNSAEARAAVSTASATYSYFVRKHELIRKQV